MGSKAPALNRIRLTYVEGASVYGPAPYRDNDQAAAIMSRSPASRCALQFMRWDEHGWDNYGPAQMTDIRAGATRDGTLTAFEFTALRDPVLLDAAGEQQVTAGTTIPARDQYAAQGRAEGRSAARSTRSRTGG